MRSDHKGHELSARTSCQTNGTPHTHPVQRNSSQVKGGISWKYLYNPWHETWDKKVSIRLHTDSSARKGKIRHLEGEVAVDTAPRESTKTARFHRVAGPPEQSRHRDGTRGRERRGPRKTDAKQSSTESCSRSRLLCLGQQRNTNGNENMDEDEENEFRFEHWTSRTEMKTHVDGPVDQALMSYVPSCLKWKGAAVQIRCQHFYVESCRSVSQRPKVRC